MAIGCYLPYVKVKIIDISTSEMISQASGKSAPKVRRNIGTLTMAYIVVFRIVP